MHGWWSRRAFDKVAWTGGLVGDERNEGLTLFQAEKGSLRCVETPILSRKTCGVPGAGDSALAVLTAGKAVGASRVGAAHLTTPLQGGCWEVR
jgi:bifunctional ADP-heptose synthase (sugar kinase/adenylyltransferase)